MIETRKPLKMFEQKWRQWATGGRGYFLAPWESKQMWYRVANPKLSDENSTFPERWHTQWRGSWEHWQLVWREKLSEARCGVRFPQSEVSAVESCPLGQFLWNWWTGRVGGAVRWQQRRRVTEQRARPRKDTSSTWAVKGQRYFLTFSFECLKEVSAYCSVVLFECTLCCGHACEWMLWH